MISRKHRFHGHHTLDFVYRKGRVARGQYASLRYVHKREGDFRLAIVVSKKVSKSAVVRNRIRRRLYEAVRARHKESGKKWNYDLVISVFDERLATIPSSELTLLVQELFSKAHIDN